MIRVIILCLILFYSCCVFAYDTNMSPELYRSYGKQQQKAKDSKGNTVLITPHYENYTDRNQNVSEKIVAIYDKHSPAYGYRYVLYTPIGSYVGHHKIMQRSPNGYGMAVKEAKHPVLRQYKKQNTFIILNGIKE